MVKRISKKHSIPQWARRIERLRSSLHLTRSQLSQELQYSMMALSRWERGLQEPPADCYIKLGKLTAGEERWFFWERAGLTKADVQSEIPKPKSAISNFDVILAGGGARKRITRKTELVAIPLLQVHAGSHGQKGDHVIDLSQSPLEEVIAAPRAWCPNPNSTSGLRVKGKSMSPSIYDGDILAVDRAQTQHANLNNKIVVALHKKKGLSVSRFRHVDGVELLESDNRDYQPITISHDRNWRVVGKVLWLIRQTS